MDGYFHPGCRKVLGGGHVDLIFLQTDQRKAAESVLLDSK